MYVTCFKTHCMMACKFGFVNSFKFYVSCIVDEIGNYEQWRIANPNQGPLNDRFYIVMKVPTYGG